MDAVLSFSNYWSGCTFQMYIFNCVQILAFIPQSVLVYFHFHGGQGHLHTPLYVRGLTIAVTVSMFSFLRCHFCCIFATVCTCAISVMLFLPSEWRRSPHRNRICGCIHCHSESSECVWWINFVRFPLNILPKDGGRNSRVDDTCA